MVSDNKDKISHRAVIRYLSLKGLTHKEKLREDAPLYSMVKKWGTDFKRGRENLEEGPHTGYHCQDS